MITRLSLLLQILSASLASTTLLPGAVNAQSRGHSENASLRVERLGDGPIVSPQSDPSIGPNIQGPSLIRVPSWIKAPLGKYYLYFADHKGRYIRLAYANELRGPWRVYVPGTLQLADSYLLTAPPPAPPEQIARLRATWDSTKWSEDFLTGVTTPHIASPDVHVDSAHRRIVMYYHGLEGLGRQVTRVATSDDGIHFEARPEVLGLTYMRVFPHGGYTYAMAMPGQFYRSADGLSGFVEGPILFEPNMRHAGLLERADSLYIFWTRIGDAPERILLSKIALSPDWTAWKDGAAVEVLRPEHGWERADAPLVASLRGTAYGHVNQLRDPAIYAEDGRLYLLYTVAGESGIALGELHFEKSSP